MKTKSVLVYFLMAGSILCYTGCGKNDAKEADNSVVKVETEQVKYADGSQMMSYSGTMEESETVPMSFNGVGTVLKVLVKEGDFVRKGQLLAVMNDETSKNAYQMSLATQKRAQDAYNRLLPMYKNGTLPEIKFIEVETALQQANSAAAISKKNLEDCRLYSLTDGMVGKRSIEPGMSVMPGIAGITVVKIEKVFARFSVSENEIVQIKKGQKAQIKVGALGNEEFSGVVEEVGVMADPIAHTYKVKVAITNRDRKLKPGMICNVFLDNCKPGSRLVVPNSSVLVDERGRNYVYTVNSSNNTVQRKYIKTGEMLTNGIVVAEGLSSGENVITAGQHKVVDNALVQVIKK